jgi:hypothetical protein
MNKKGATLQLWIEVLLFIIIFLGVMAIIGSDMNTKYGQSHDLTIGLNLSKQLQSIAIYKDDLMNSTSGGQAELTDFGILKLGTTAKILMGVTSILWNFLTGRFIWDLIATMNIGDYGLLIGTIFQILYIIAIGYILLKLVLRANV